MAIFYNDTTGGMTSTNPGATSNINCKQSRRFLDNPDVKGYHSTMVDSLFSNKKCRWESVGEVEGMIKEYFSICLTYNICPTLSGVCVWLNCPSYTIRRIAQDINSPFNELMQQVINICQLYLENSTIEGKTNPALYIFLGKNYFGMKDNQEITLAPKETTVNNQETVNAIREQLLLEEKK